jgi:hypothetical protein
MLPLLKVKCRVLRNRVFERSATSRCYLFCNRTIKCRFHTNFLKDALACGGSLSGIFLLWDIFFRSNVIFLSVVDTWCCNNLYSQMRDDFLLGGGSM